MPKYRTLIHVKYQGDYIEPDTEVDVPDEDVSSWDELVNMHLAERVGKAKKKEEPSPPLPEDEGLA